jgi:5-hydroxyisourate hydrolase-like protein (transthyretin family)
VTANHTLKAVFTQKPIVVFTIVADADINGTISPFGNVLVEEGENQQFVISAKPNYIVDQIIVDNVPLADIAAYRDGSAYKYTFSFVRGNHTISVKTRVSPPVVLPVFITNTIEGVANGIQDALGTTDASTPIIVAIPAVAAAGAASLPTMMSTMSGTGLLNLLLAGIGYRKKNKKKWGRVVSDDTGLPVSGVRVQLIRVVQESATDTVLRKSIAEVYTDKDGDFGFVAEPGLYQLDVYKENSTVSTMIPGFYNPGSYIEIKNPEQGLVIPDIAMTLDHASLEKRQHSTKNVEIAERILAVASFLFLVVGTFVSLDDLINNFGAEAIILSGIYAFLWIVNVSNAVSHKSPWGVIVDSTTGKVVPMALVRIMDKEGKKIIKTVISNEFGRYSSFVPKGKYQVIVSRPGYAMMHPAFYSGADQMNTVNVVVQLKKKD